MNALVLFVATAGLVFALGLQSLNVNGRHFVAAGCTSFMIGAANLVLFKTLPGPTSGLELAGYLCGGPVGILAAMVLHPRMVNMWTRLAEWRRHRAVVRTLPTIAPGLLGLPAPVDVPAGDIGPDAAAAQSVAAESTAPRLIDEDFAGWLTGLEKTLVFTVCSIGLFVWACVGTYFIRGGQ